MTITIADKRTPIEPEEASRLLANAYANVMGRKPSVAILKLLIGQSALESGNWKQVHNYNFGNEKASSSDVYQQVYTFGDDPTDAGAYYAAFVTPEEGAEHYVHTLTKREHWRKGLESGKPLTFIEALSTPPVYFTADPMRYMATLVNRMDAYESFAKKYGASILGIWIGASVIILGGIAAGLAWKR